MRAAVVALSIACAGCQLILGIQTDVLILPDPGDSGSEGGDEPDSEGGGVVLRDSSARDAGDAADAETHKDARADASFDGG